MNFWEILEIDPTDNVSLVKKAYAKKLKVHHPEDDPEGYQKLREAYDSAIKYLKNNKNKVIINNSNKENFEIPETTFKDDNIQSDNPVLPNFNVLEELNEKPLSYEEIVDDFIEKAQNLYNDFFARIEIDNWLALLNSEAMWYIGDKELLSNSMLEFLIENHYFPADIWKVLQDNFNWNEQKNYLYDEYDESFVDYLFKHINDNNGLRYSYFKEGQIFDSDTFLMYREEAFEALSIEDFEYAEECINKAYNIYSEDPDLLILKGKYYSYMREQDKALEIFDTVVEMYTDDIYARFCKAKVLYDIGQIDIALEDCIYIKAHNYDNVDFLLIFAKCYFKLEKYNEAKELFLKLLKVDSCKREVKELLRQIDLQLLHKLKGELKKDKNDKIKVKALNRLYRELGIMVPNEVIKKLSLIMIRRIFICVFLLFIQVTVIHTAMKNMNIKAPDSIKNTIQFLMFSSISHPIKDIEDINKLPIEMSKVKGTLTDAQFIDLYRIPTNNNYGKSTNIYLSLDEAKEKDLFNDINGYVCYGNLDDKKIIAIVDYKQAKQAYDSKTIDFDGLIHYMPEDDLLSEVKKRYTTNTFETLFITDVYLDSEIKVSNAREISLIIDSLILFIQATLIIQGLLAGFMILKENRKKMIF